jgi:hypothetical protein
MVCNDLIGALGDWDGGWTTRRMVGPLDWSEAAVAWLGRGMVGLLDGRVQPVRTIVEAKLGVAGPWDSSGFGCLGRGMVGTWDDSARAWLDRWLLASGTT